MNLVTRKKAAEAFNCSLPTFDKKYRYSYGFPTVKSENGKDMYDADKFEEYKRKAHSMSDQKFTVNVKLNNVAKLKKLTDLLAEQIAAVQETQNKISELQITVEIDN